MAISRVALTRPRKVWWLKRLEVCLPHYFITLDRFTVINYKPLTTIEDYTLFLQHITKLISLNIDNAKYGYNETDKIDIFKIRN